MFIRALIIIAGLKFTKDAIQTEQYVKSDRKARDAAKRYADSVMEKAAKLSREATAALNGEGEYSTLSLDERKDKSNALLRDALSFSMLAAGIMRDAL